MRYKTVVVQGTQRTNYVVRFAFQPFVKFRSSRQDLPPIEGIARVSDRIDRWVAQLEAQEGAPQ
jgi:hypothetical protein